MEDTISTTRCVIIPLADCLDEKKKGWVLKFDGVSSPYRESS